MKTPQFFIFLALVFFLSGCAGINFKSEPVDFEDPVKILKIVSVSPTAQETQGILLRLQMPVNKEIHAEENLKIYSQLHNNQGMSLNLHQKTVETYTPVSGKDSFILHSETTFEGEGGKITEESEISPRGEVLRFIEGFHDSKVGKFRVSDETRTPIYPEAPVKIGDKWQFEEKMDARMESFWITEKDPTPYERKAESELTGFAEVSERRCAVIKTKSIQTKTETIKVLFKTLTMDIRAEIEEIDYFDYQKGILAAKVTKTQSHSAVREANLQDEGISQSIYRILD